MSRSHLLPLLALAACSAPAAVAPPVTTPPSPTPVASQPAPSPAAPPAPPAVPERAAGYDLPPKPVLDVLHAPSPPRPYVNPTGDTVLLTSMVDYLPMSRIAEPYLRLAGVRVEPRTRRKHDTPGGYGVNSCARGMSLVNIATTKEIPVALPPGGCVESPLFSPDGQRFVFRSTQGEAVELWVGNTATGQVHRVGDVRLNPMLGTSTVQWAADDKTVLVKLVPANAGPPPAAAHTLDGPSIQESNGQKGESSTYETRDTLTGKHDEELFDYYATTQLAWVDTESAQVTPVGKPGILAGVDISPDGQHLLVESIHKPYSYVVIFERFPVDIEVWDRNGQLLHTMTSRPLADRVPIEGVPVGPREFAWRATAPATLIWAEAQDGGDWKTKVPARDKVLMQAAPFTAPPTELSQTEQRFTGITWGEDPHFALLHEHDENRHWNRTFTFDVDAPGTKPKLLFDRSSDEHYKDPGTPVLRELPNGTLVIRQTGGAMFLSGMGSSPEGDRPFLDRLDLASLQTVRLYRSERSAFDVFVAFTDASSRAFLSWRQSPTDPPNGFQHVLGEPVPSAPAGEPQVASTSAAITHLPDPAPAVRAIKKRLVKYKRKDGVDLSFTLYTPPDYQEGTRVPAILYAYPLDYADASKAGQVTGSEQTFTRLTQYRLLLLAGYAIIDNTAFPIVGDPKKAYDTYLDQLVEDATAAVHKAVDLGVVDPDRVGVTGHSHGALMTVNLLAHSTLFRAGIATSGSYNKTLTPFGFQSERRSVWDATSVYLKVSPFFFADKLKLPLLIMHGAEDANPGTTPLQAVKLFEAVRGNGGTVRLVMLPHEPHWYSAMESQEQQIYEMIRWFDTYVKNAPPMEHPRKS